MSTKPPNAPVPYLRSRRDFLCSAWNGIGSLALVNILADELEAGPSALNPLAPREPHLRRKAKHCIFLFMGGGVSHIESFDYKPALQKYAGERLPRPEGLSGEVATALDAPHTAMPSLWDFKQYGESGRHVCSLFPHLAQHVDEMAFAYGIRLDNNNHGPATLHLNTGSQFPGSPSVGSWVGYGLGTPNQNLPGYVVIQDPRGGPVNGSAVWGNGYLPASYQGVRFRSSGPPILDLERPAYLAREQQRREFDLLKWLNIKHVEQQPGASELEARINAYELAFRMQTAAPEVVDLDRESEATKKLYGLDNPDTAGFGRQCLLARRLVEQGVRYTLLIHGERIGQSSWDHHTDVKGRMPQNAVEVDKPVSALLTDLKSRGLLEETLVVWASEMGRTPYVQQNDTPDPKPGRDHNQNALVMWMAGGNVKGGSSVGATDEFGIGGINPIPLHDVHATILNLLGLDDKRLTYLHQGRYRKLTDIGGHVLRELIA